MRLRPRVVSASAVAAAQRVDVAAFVGVRREAAEWVHAATLEQKDEKREDVTQCHDKSFPEAYP